MPFKLPMAAYQSKIAAYFLNCSELWYFHTIGILLILFVLYEIHSYNQSMHHSGCYRHSFLPICYILAIKPIHSYRDPIFSPRSTNKCHLPRICRRASNNPVCGSNNTKYDFKRFLTGSTFFK